MGKNDTITCGVTPCAGCIMPSTASVFRAVTKEGFATQNGCCREESNGWSGRGCSGGCDNSCNDGCDTNSWAQRNGNNCDACDTCKGNQRSGGKSTCGCNDNRSGSNCCGNSRQNGCHASGWVQEKENHCNDCDECNAFGGNQRSGNCCNNPCNGVSRSNDCDCCNDCNNCNTRNRSGKNRTPAMVYEEEHQLSQLHEAEEAIRKGTLFSQLYMPMNGECADACGAQLCDGQAEAFAAWELRLYLNTHPCDQQALQMFRKMARKACQPNYASTFAQDCEESWSWTDAPWPWDFNCGCE